MKDINGVELQVGQVVSFRSSLDERTYEGVINISSVAPSITLYYICQNYLLGARCATGNMGFRYTWSIGSGEYYNGKDEIFDLTVMPAEYKIKRPKTLAELCSWLGDCNDRP